MTKPLPPRVFRAKDAEGQKLFAEIFAGESQEAWDKLGAGGPRCPMCDGSFADCAVFIEHVQSVHKEDQPFARSLLGGIYVNTKRRLRSMAAAAKRRGAA